MGLKYNNREQMLRSKYGITGEDFDRMYVEQRGCCYICKEPFESKSKAHIDHDHATGAVRKLLCTCCNTGLGMFREKIRLLAAAIVYLEDHGKG